MESGTYRLTKALVPKSNDTLIGEGNAVLNGSKLLASWTKNGNQWIHTGDTKNVGTLIGECEDNTDACLFPDDVFRDGVPLTRVLSLSSLNPGEVFIDYTADAIYVEDDPANATMELATATQAFTGANSGVELRGFTVEKFAGDAENAAVELGDSWVADGLEVRFNHGAGIDTFGDGSIARNNYVHHQGFDGFRGDGGSDVLVENNEIAYNNTAGYDYGWGGGGSKWTNTVRLTVRDNYSHDNVGPGLWTDIDNIYTVYDGNIVSNNEDAGIFHEISYDAIITNNIVTGNGFGRGDWLWGAGIQIAASGNLTGTMEISGNTVNGNANGIALIQQDRGDGDYGPYRVQNVLVNDNTVTMCVGSSGAADGGFDEIYDLWNNHFESNVYHTDTSTSDWWAWDDNYRDWSTWHDYGEDDRPPSSWDTRASC